jgi:hypothetical protein
MPCSTSQSHVCSDLGVIKLVIEAIQAWILASSPMAAIKNQRLRELSIRVERLTYLHPDAVNVFGMFLEKGPVLQGAHYRLVLIDQPFFLLVRF